MVHLLGVSTTLKKKSYSLNEVKWDVIYWVTLFISMPLKESVVHFFTLGFYFKNGQFSWSLLATLEVIKIMRWEFRRENSLTHMHICTFSCGYTWIQISFWQSSELKDLMNKFCLEVQYVITIKLLLNPLIICWSLWLCGLRNDTIVLNQVSVKPYRCGLYSASWSLFLFVCGTS